MLGPPRPEPLAQVLPVLGLPRPELLAQVLEQRAQVLELRAQELPQRLPSKCCSG